VDKIERTEIEILTLERVRRWITVNLREAKDALLGYKCEQQKAEEHGKRQEEKKR
jgi:hypothetical protein